jgi:NADPH2:quinone reductase
LNIGMACWYGFAMQDGEQESQDRMRTIIVRSFGGPEVMRVEETTIPVPGPEQVLVRLHAAGVNPVDTYIRSGNYGRLPTLPYTPGMDGAGVVVASKSPSVRVDDRVYVGRSLTGTYAQYALCHASHVHALPAALTFDQGAGVHVPYWTAMRAIVQKAMAVPGEWMLVHGATGGVGLAAVQIGRRLGLGIIATAGTPQGMELLKAQGVDHVLDHHDPEVVRRVQAITNHPEGGVNIVLEMLAHVNLEKDLAMAAMRGRIVVIGNRGRIEINPRDAMSRDISILGMSLFNASKEEQVELSHRVAGGLSSGAYAPVIRASVGMSQAPAAHELVLENGSLGKIVLHPWG